MHQRKSKKILLYFFLLIVFSSISNYSLNDLKLNQIKNINISGLEQKDKKILFDKLKTLSKENIFLINKNEIVKLINSNFLVEKYEVFKKYPSTIYVNVQKTNFLAKINKKGKIFFIGSNGKLIPVKNHDNNLPYIFGKPDINEFLKFKEIIDKSKFSYDSIDNLYFFPSNRWDIKLKEDILLKLPQNYTHLNLDIMYEFLKNNRDKSLAIVDHRIGNQIILNE